MSEPKKTVRFLKKCTVRDHNGDIEQEFEEGEVKELVESSADRWIRRDAAVEHDGEAPGDKAPADMTLKELNALAEDLELDVPKITGKNRDEIQPAIEQAIAERDAKQD